MHHVSQAKGKQVAVLTVSDTRNKENDKSGKAIISFLEEAEHNVSEYQLVKDEPKDLHHVITAWCENPDVEVILMNGGTGFSPRDTTYEVVHAILEKKMDGFGELFRMLSYEEIGAKAMFSRAIAGSRGRTAIYAMPGSTNAVKLAMEKLILPTVPHFVDELHKQ